MRLNKAIAEYLIRRLKDFNEWGQCIVLDLLHRYQPETEDESYEFMVIRPSIFFYFFRSTVSSVSLTDQ